MRRIIVLAAVLTITAARPETYREKEDFQYSRSSSDEGSKAGYYGAQRGNMGGNYERAHNMDSLAQHQMSGLVRQVEGELGEGANQRSGKVFTSANSQGIYGSGHYDLSHLQGRNFQEGVSYDTAQSQSAHNSGSMGQLSSSVANGGYDSTNAYNSRYRGYNSARNSNQMLYVNNQHHSADDLHSANQQQSRYDSNGSEYNLQSGYHRETGYNQANYDSSNRYGSHVQNRLVGASMPVRVVVRPGTMVTVPVAAQTYRAGQSSSTFDHNAINTEAESLSGRDEQTGYTQSYKPKHYESSYSYRKEWEKQDTQPMGVPLAIPTVSPYPKNSELYEDTRVHNSAHQQESSSVDTHNVDSRLTSAYNVKSASSSQSRQQAGYNALHHSTATSADSSAYSAGQHNNGAALSQVLNNQVEDLNSKPKSYQSSYSYHKSWERQGDPYVIIPTNNDNAASQKLVTSNHGAYGDSHKYGSHYQYGTQHQRYVKNGDVDCDCDENGNIRVARSVGFENQQQEDLTQQTQTNWDNMEDLSQHSQNLESLGQQTQQSWSNSEDLGQQTQNLDFTQQSEQNWNNKEDLGQTTQNLEFTQQNQNKWDQNEELGQQTQSHWSPDHTTGQQTERLDLQVENFGQQTQNQWTQQDTEPKHKWNTLELEPQTQTGTEQQIENKEIPTSMSQPIQIEGISTPDNSKSTGVENWDIRVSGTDKGPNIQDNWKFNSSQSNTIKPWHRISQSISEQSQSDKFYGYNSDKKSLNHELYNPYNQIYNEFYNAQSNNYDQRWQTYAAEHNESSKLLNQSDSSKSLAVDSQPLSSIWNKLDILEKQNNNSQKNDDFSVDYPAPIDFSFGVYKDTKNIDVSPLHTEKPWFEKIETTTPKISFTTKPRVNPIKINYVNRIYKPPQDIGRGDIGPEDALNIVTTLENSPFIAPPVFITSSKTKEDIKTSTLNNNYESLETSTEPIINGKNSSSNDLKKSTQNKQIINDDYVKNITSLTTAPFANMQNINAIQQNQQSLNELFGSIDQQQDTVFKKNGSENWDQSIAVLGQRNENAGVDYFEQQVFNENQQPTNQASNNQENISYIDNQSNNFETQPKNENQSNNFEQQAPNFGQNTPNFEKHTTTFELQTPILENQFHLGHLLNNFDQHSTNFEQQSSNLEDTSNFVQHSTNIEQQSSNLDNSPNFGQSLPNSEQQSIIYEQQQLPVYKQHSTTFEQTLPNFEKHKSNFEQHLHSFEQHSPNYVQYSSNFEQDLPNFGPPTYSFANNAPQSPAFEQNSPNVVGHPVIVEQQHPKNDEQPDIDEQSFNFEHQLDNFDQQEGMSEQQSNLQPQDEDVHQQNLPSHRDKDFRFEEREENQVSVPVYNAQGHWVRKHGELKQQNGNLNKKIAWNESPSNLNQKIQKEWEVPMENALETQNIGMFSPISNMPELINQDQNSDPAFPKVVTVTESTNESQTQRSFWKSVTSKFTRAKSKVKSWFISKDAKVI